MAPGVAGIWCANLSAVPGCGRLGQPRVIFPRGVVFATPKSGMLSLGVRSKGRIVMRGKANSKVGGPTASELKLLKELQEFITGCDLPPGEVPTMTELIRNGRQDLANRVRRKGYKQLTQLLEQLRLAEAGESTKSDSVRPNDSVETKVFGTDDLGSGLPLGQSSQPFSNERKKPTDVRSSNGGASSPLPLLDGSASKPTNFQKEQILKDPLKYQLDLVPGVVSNRRSNVETGGLSIEECFDKDSKQTIPNEGISGTNQPLNHQEVIDNSEGGRNGQDHFETGDMEEDEVEDDEIEKDENIKSQSSEVAALKAELLRTKLQQYFNSRSDSLKQASSPPTFQENKAKQVDHSDTALPDDQSKATGPAEINKELDHLKGLLNSRELELSEVSRQLEEAKGMLALARAKATADLVHVKQLAVEQDVKLKLIEQSISQMKQIHLEWWGEGNHVEVSGSFNGWQHSIVLEPDFSSEIPKSDGARGPMMWGTHLCLYPGVYEIKFIIDGNWQIDHRREVVMRHTNQNNILRVE